MEGTLINELKGKAVVLKANDETSQSISTKFGLRSIPADVVFHKGEVVEVMYGRLIIGATASPLVRRELINRPPIIQLMVVQPTISSNGFLNEL
ncbi:hypothetical protein BCU23_25225 [Vibrio splendidus]|nr:hypothetical protein BCU23_25225 [Vibrio splendidus]